MSNQLTSLIFAVASTLSVFTTGYLVYEFKNNIENKIKKGKLIESFYFFKMLGAVLKFIWPTFLIFLSAYLLSIQKYTLFGLVFSTVGLYYILLIWIVAKRNNDEDSFATINAGVDEDNINKNIFSKILFSHWISKKENKRWSKILWWMFWINFSIMAISLTLVLISETGGLSQGFKIYVKEKINFYSRLSAYISVSSLEVTIFLIAYKSSSIFNVAVENNLKTVFPDQKNNLFYFSTYSDSNESRETLINIWKEKVLSNISKNKKNDFHSFFEECNDKDSRIIIGLLSRDEYNINRLLQTKRIKHMIKDVAGEENTKKIKKQYDLLSEMKDQLEQVVKNEEIEYPEINNLLECYKGNFPWSKPIQKTAKIIKGMKFKHNFKLVLDMHLRLINEMLNKKKHKYFKVSPIAYCKLKRIKKRLENISEFKKSTIKLINYSRGLIDEKELLASKDYINAGIQLSLVKLHFYQLDYIFVIDTLPDKYMNHKY